MVGRAQVASTNGRYHGHGPKLSSRMPACTCHTRAIHMRDAHVHTCVGYMFEQQDACPRGGVVVQLGVQQAHARVASADNVLADLISRGDEGVAERFAETAGVACLRLHLSEGQRTLHGIPPTWH